MSDWEISSASSHRIGRQRGVYGAGTGQEGKVGHGQIFVTQDNGITCLCRGWMQVKRIWGGGKAAIVRKILEEGGEQMGWSIKGVSSF